MTFRFNFVAAAVLAVLTGACSDDDSSNDGPVPVPETSRITQIITSIPSQRATSRMQFTYDSKGRVTSVNDITSSGSTVIEYTYGDGTVNIATETTTAREGTVRYADRLTLSDSRVVRTDGSYTWLREDGSVYSHRDYTYIYTYDGNGHLTAIRRAEWDGTMTTVQNPWVWTDRLEWQGDLLMKYIDYDGHTFPTNTFTYEYAGEAVVLPVVIPFTYHAQYDPLVRTGYFGRIPSRPISQRTQTGLIGEQYIRKYTYSISGGRIGEWSAIINYGTDKAYTVYSEATYAR